MSERKRIFFLLLIMTTVSLVVGGIAISVLYHAAIEKQRQRLVEIAQSRACLIEAIARFNALYNKDYPEGPEAATLNQIRDAHQHFKGFGETGEFVLARREGNCIVCLLSHRHYDLENLKPVPFGPGLAEPMRRALLGQSGTAIVLDYRGAIVLAAYEPVAELNLGIVAKIDLAEIRAPFVRAGVVVGGAALLVVLLGSVLFLRVGNPMIRRLQELYQTAQQELAQRQRAEGRFWNLWQSALAAMVMVNQDGKIVLVNSQVEAMFGYTKEELIGQSIEMLVPERFRRQHSEYRAGFFVTPSTRPMGAGRDLYGRHKDGREVPVEIGLNPLVTEEGAFVLASIVDITERQRAQEALRQHAQRLEALQEREATLNGVIAQIRGSLKLEDVLQATVDELLALTQASRCCIYSSQEGTDDIVITLEACAAGINSIIGLRIPASVSPLMRRMRETKAIVAHKSVRTDPAFAEARDLIEFTQVRSILVCPLILNGDIIGVIGLHQCDYERDWTEEDLSLLQSITDGVALAIEHARLFENVRRGEQEWQMTFQAMADGVFLFDKNGTIKRANQAFATMFGLATEQVIGVKVYQLLYGVNERPADCLFLTAVDEKRAVYRETDQLKLPGTFNLSASLIFDEMGEVSGGVGTIRNITQEKKLRDELARSARLAAVGQMTAQLAHEIKNPLTSLKLYSRHLQTMLQADPGTSEIARKLTNTIDDLTSTVNEIAEVVQPVALKLELTHINEPLREAIELVAEQARNREVRITAHLTPDLPSGNFDRRQLKKVFLNLLLNALDASSAGGEIEVTSSFEADCPIEQGVKELAVSRGVLISTLPYRPGERANLIHVRIVDHGRGMDRTTLGRIFEPFFTTKPQGMGLGLIIAQAIIDQQGGLLYIDSEPGVGTTALICLKIQ